MLMRNACLSRQHLDLIGTTFSINDYQHFFDKTFAPINIPSNQPVDMPPIKQRYEDEYTPEELEKMNSDNDTNSDDDGGEWY